jgi:hypothetical protein
MTHLGTAFFRHGYRYGGPPLGLLAGLAFGGTSPAVAIDVRPTVVSPPR